jgi:hypothetical protein
LPDRRRRRNETDPNTGDDAAGDHLRELEGRGLHGAANEDGGSAKADTTTATEGAPVKRDDQGAKEGANLAAPTSGTAQTSFGMRRAQDGDDSRGGNWISDGGEDADEGGLVDETSIDALHAREQDSNGRALRT